MMRSLVSLLIVLSLANAEATQPPVRSLKVLVQNGYLPQVPVLVRVEARNAKGDRDWGLWDAQATLAASATNVVLSTNRVQLRNGMGSALVLFSGGGDFNLNVSLDGLSTNRSLKSLATAPVTSVSGTLAGTNSVWSGIIRVTADVIVPTNHTLNISPGTLVLLAGVTNGTNGADIEVRGTMLALGTEDQPICFTASTNGMSWGEIRHVSARPSTYRNCILTRACRSPAVGHTGTGPVFRSTGSRIALESCSIADNVGKVMQASAGSDIFLNDCLMTRSRMGPEIDGTALLSTNSYFMEMAIADDGDGIYLHDQQAGQTITVTGCVFAYGGDDAIDTLGSTVTIENSLLRNFDNPLEDSKGVSVFGGEVRINHCLIVDNGVGVSGKGNNAENVRVRIDRSTIISPIYGVGVSNKSGTLPVIDYRITNSIIRAQIPINTDYDPADIHVEYSDLSTNWPGMGNITNAPLFMDEAPHDFRLQSNSPCINAGNPDSPLDPDGTRADIGFYSFSYLPTLPVLSAPTILSNRNFQFTLSGPIQSYLIESSINLSNWISAAFLTNTPGLTRWTDTNAAGSAFRYYRARVTQ